MTPDQAPPPGPRPRVPGAAALALLCIAIAVPSYLIGLRLPPSEGPDIVADWLVTRAAVDGADPYANPEELAARYGVEYRFRTTPELDSAAVSHPRTPGALVVMTPLLLFPPERLNALAVAVTLVCIVLVVLLGLDMARAPSWLAVPIVLLALPTPPTILALHHATQSGVVALLVTYGIWTTSRRDSAAGGLALGVATVLKVFPLLLLLPLALGRRRRAGLLFAGSVAALTLAGFAFPEVGPAVALDALQTAGSNWITLSANGSLARVLTLAGVSPAAAPLLCGVTVGLVAVAVVIVGARRGVRLEDQLLVTLAIALLWIPLSWIHYDLALYPVAVVAGVGVWKLEAHVVARSLCVALVGLSFAPLAMDPGLLGAGRRTLLAAALLVLHSSGTPVGRIGESAIQRALSVAREASGESGGPSSAAKTPR